VTATRQIVLVKHASTDDNESGIHQGQGRDGGLSAKGRRQSERVAAMLAGVRPSRLWCSPMQRAVETAAILQSAWLNPPHIEIEPRLLPKDSGELSGQDRREIHRRARSANQPVADYVGTGTESSHTVQRRVVEFWDGSVTASGDDAVLVSHGDVLACLVLWLTGQDFDGFDRMLLPPAGVWIAEYVAPHAAASSVGRLATGTPPCLTDKTHESRQPQQPDLHLRRG
jgi:broad specificity phosphatase PhoE